VFALQDIRAAQVDGRRSVLWIELPRLTQDLRGLAWPFGGQQACPFTDQTLCERDPIVWPLPC
jgi:hypothetical protein